MNAPSSSPSQHPGYPIVIGILALLAVALGALIIMNQNNAERDKKVIAELTSTVDDLRGEMKTLRTPPPSPPTPPTSTPEVPPAPAPLTWQPYGARFGTLNFQYPKNWYVLTSPRIQCEYEKETCLTIQNSPLDMVLTGGVGCAEGAPCTEQGLQIELARMSRVSQIPGTVTSTSIQGLLKDDLSLYCDEADGPCFAPQERYFYRNGKDMYRITVYTKNYDGDIHEVVDQFLARLTPEATATTSTK